MIRTILLLTCFSVACTSEPTIQRSEVQYGTHPGTGECIVPPQPDGTPTAGWTACEPDCSATGSCNEVCPLSCEATAATPPDCPNGFVVGTDGCPVCECYVVPPCGGTGTPPTPGGEGQPTNCGCTDASGQSTDCDPTGGEPTTPPDGEGTAPDCTGSEPRPTGC